MREGRSEVDEVLHGLRNAINVLVTSGRCLQDQAANDSGSRDLVLALEQGAGDARRLLDRLQDLVRERDA